MLAFQFSRRDGQLPVSGFDIGDMSVIGGLGTVSSRGHTPDQGMMIYIAVANLLDGLRVLLKSGQGTYRFVGADSSFSLGFTAKKGRISISVGRLKVDESSAAEVADAMRNAAEEFASRELHHLTEGDAARRDLAAALAEFPGTGGPTGHSMTP